MATLFGELTKLHIENLGAGRELDALIAEKIMGWKKAHDPLEDRMFWVDVSVDDVESVSFDYYADEWQPSTDIATAMRVAEKTKFKERMQRSLQLRWAYVHDRWAWEFSIGGIWATAATAPLAICRAALLTLVD